MIPSLEEQGFPYHKIENDDLCGIADVKFNGSVIDYNGKTLLAYRGYNIDNGGRMKIHLAELDKDWNVTGCRPLHLYTQFTKPILEDCRLFIHKGDLWITYVDIQFSTHVSCLIQCCKLDKDYNVVHALPTISYGQNKLGGVEKNWVFFSHRDELYVIYNVRNHHILKIHDKTGKILERYETPQLFWPYGHMRGGTPPERIGDKYLSFFHSSDYKQWHRRKYAMTPYTFEAKPPFTIMEVGEQPMIWGSDSEPFCGSGNGYCVFPMGYVKRGNDRIVSAGINDTFNAMIQIKPERVADNIVPASMFHTPPNCYFFSAKAYNVPEPDGVTRNWTVFRSTAKGRFGVLHTNSPEVICELRDKPATRQISKEDYEALINREPETYKRYVGVNPPRPKKKREHQTLYPQ